MAAGENHEGEAVMIKTVWVVGMAALVMTMGCRRAGESLAEKIAEKAIERQSGGKAKVDLDASKQTVTIKTKEGEFVAASGEGVKIPADFPKDVPVYKDAKILMAVSNPEGVVLSLESKDGIETIAEKYAAEMKALGWEQQAAMDMGAQKMLAYNKEKRNSTITITKADKGSQITISAEKEKQDVAAAE
jgi:hypothetical protein